MAERRVHTGDRKLIRKPFSRTVPVNHVLQVPVPSTQVQAPLGIVQETTRLSWGCPARDHKLWQLVTGDPTSNTRRCCARGMGTLGICLSSDDPEGEARGRSTFTLPMDFFFCFGGAGMCLSPIGTIPNCLVDIFCPQALHGVEIEGRGAHWRSPPRTQLCTTGTAWGHPGFHCLV